VAPERPASRSAPRRESDGADARPRQLALRVPHDPNLRHGARTPLLTGSVAPEETSAPPASARKRRESTPSVVGWPADQTRPAGEAARARAVRPSGHPDARVALEGAYLGSSSDSGSHPREIFMGEGEAA
jgi:hypothetical protein